MSGYCATGMEISARSPAIVVTMAMTMASRGRSTNTADSTALLRPERGCDRRRLDRSAGTNALQPLYDDLLAALEAGFEHGIAAIRPLNRDPPHRGLAVLDDEHVGPALVCDQRRLRNHDSFIGFAGLKDHAHQLPVEQRAAGIWHGGAGGDGVGGAIDGDVDEVDRS